MLKLFLFEPDEMYSGGATGVAAASLDAAHEVMREYAEVNDYWRGRRFCPISPEPVVGVRISGKPRVLFDRPYAE